MENEIKKIEKEIAELKEIKKSFNQSSVPNNIAVNWTTRIGNLIDKLYSKDSQMRKNYLESIEMLNKYFRLNLYYDSGIIEGISGILDAIFSDFKNGLINDTKQLLRAEIFSDFIEMAEYLLDEGYKDASAVILGTILEDSLRKLALANEIDINKPAGKNYKTLDALNSDLSNNNIYNKLIQKQITSWADLRNNAAHGHREKYTEVDVRQMLLFIQSFAERFLV